MIRVFNQESESLLYLTLALNRIEAYSYLMYLMLDARLSKCRSMTSDFLLFLYVVLDRSSNKYMQTPVAYCNPSSEI